MTVLLLDFEKAYDRVDWDLRELSSDLVFLAVGSVVSRVSTALPLLLSLLVAVVTSLWAVLCVRAGLQLHICFFSMRRCFLVSYVDNQSTTVQGLHLRMPTGDQEELESAGDMMLLTAFSKGTLDRMCGLIDCFLSRHCARVNWNKSSGMHGCTVLMGFG